MRPRSFGVRTVSCTSLLGVLLTSGSCTAQTKEIAILALDGKTGRPIANEHLLVFEGDSQTNIGKKHSDLKTDENGIAMLSLDDPSISRIQVFVDFHVLCQKLPNGNSFSVDEVERNGLATPNICGKATLSNFPSRLVVFAWPPTLLDRARE